MLRICLTPDGQSQDHFRATSGAHELRVWGIKGNIFLFVSLFFFAAVLLVLLLFWGLNMIPICWIAFLLDDEGAEL